MSVQGCSPKSGSARTEVHLAVEWRAVECGGPEGIQGRIFPPFAARSWRVGAATIRQYLQAGFVDEMHVAVSPILLGQGEPLFEGIDLPALGYRVQEHVCTEAAMHLVVGR